MHSPVQASTSISYRTLATGSEEPSAFSPARSGSQVSYGNAAGSAGSSTASSPTGTDTSRSSSVPSRYAAGSRIIPPVLPPPKPVTDWKVFKDASGKEYYYSRRLRRSTWTTPDSLRPPEEQRPITEPSNAVNGEPAHKPAEEVPKRVAKVTPPTRKALQTFGDWCEVFDEPTQKRYYHNKVTKATQWNPPPGWPVEAVSAVSSVQPGSVSSDQRVPVAPSASSSLLATSNAQAVVSSVDPVVSSGQPVPALSSGRPATTAPPTVPSSSTLLVRDTQTVSSSAQSPSSSVPSPSSSLNTSPSDPAGPDRSSGPPLPQPWKRAWDPATNRSYYVNTVTKETTWNRPGAPSEVWATAVDPATQRVYYFNKETRESRWTPPNGLQAPEQQSTHQSTHQSALPQPLHMSPVRRGHSVGAHRPSRLRVEIPVTPADSPAPSPHLSLSPLSASNVLDPHDIWRQRRERKAASMTLPSPAALPSPALPSVRVRSKCLCVCVCATVVALVSLHACHRVSQCASLL